MVNNASFKPGECPALKGAVCDWWWQQMIQTQTPEWPDNVWIPVGYQNPNIENTKNMLIWSHLSGSLAAFILGIWMPPRASPRRRRARARLHRAAEVHDVVTMIQCLAGWNRVKHLATKGINHWLWKEWKGQVSQVQHCAILWMSALCTLRLVEAGLDPDSMLPDTWLRWIRFDYCFVLCVAEREILFMWLKWCVFTIFSLDRHSADAENVLNCSQECVTRQVRALQCKDRSSLLTYASAGDGSPHFDLVTLTAQECIMRSRCWFGYGLACARRFVSLVPAQPLSVILRSRAEGNSIAPQV